MNRKNDELKDLIVMFDSNLLNRIRLVKGDLKNWLQVLKKSEISKILYTEDFINEIKFVLEFMTENYDIKSRELFYNKMLKNRVPIYQKHSNVREIIMDSFKIISIISDKGDSLEKEKVCNLLADLRDNFIKIKLTVIALQGYFDKIDTYLDYYFQLQSKVIAVADHVQEIFEEYCKENNCISI